MAQHKDALCNRGFGHAVLAVVLFGALVALPGFALADETGEEPGPVTESITDAVAIYDADGLAAMAADPHASYKLMADVDLEGQPWKPLDFYGALDGNGHAILNARVSDTGAARGTTYDGNMKTYDTAFSGFFGTLEGATVRDLGLLGIEVDIETAEPTFAGALCGHLNNSVVEGCTIEGQVSLATTGMCFGVGGVAGYGFGSIRNNVANVTLVCRDLDTVAKDEQFMGGAYAAGYADLEGNDIALAGFDSDHGYVHDGGLVGMYNFYPHGVDYAGVITNNKVSGAITFFEDNLDRRAYCEPVVGELMEWNVRIEGNTDDFVRDERFEYATDLLPHGCADPQWGDNVADASCTEYGYTLRTCTACGYSYKTAWRAPAHEVESWESVSEPDEKGMVVQEGTCARCGETVYRKAAQGESAQGLGADFAEESESAGEQGSRATVPWKLIGIIAAILLVVLIVLGIVLVRQTRRRRIHAAQRAATSRAHRPRSGRDRG